MIKVSFIINTARALSNSAKTILQQAERSKKLDVTYYYTEQQKHAIDLAEKASVLSDVVVAVGGDGTNSEVVRGIVQSGKDVAFAVVENGTGNDFARNLPKDTPEEFVAKLERCEPVSIDLGEVMMKENTTTFLNIADIGFGAKVVELMNRQRRIKIGGKLSYSLAIIRAFFSYRKSEVLIEGDGFSYRGKVLLVAFCNGPVFGHGLTIHPEAKIDSGKLCITVVGDVSLMTYLRKLGDLKKGCKINHPEAHYFETGEVRIVSFQKTLMMEGDGELLGAEVKEVRILPGKLKLIR